jgi:hypothetical protein
MLVTAFNSININPRIWIAGEEHGLYFSLQEFAVEGNDWAQIWQEKQRQKAALENLNPSNLEEKEVVKRDRTEIRF